MATPRASQLFLLYELGCAFAGQIELDELIPLVIDKCRDVLDAEGGSVLLLDEARGELFIPYVVAESTEAADRLSALRVPLAGSIAGAVVTSGTPLRVDDATSDPRFYGGADRQTGVTTQTLLAAPLRARHGIIGVIEVPLRKGST